MAADHHSLRSMIMTHIVPIQRNMSLGLPLSLSQRAVLSVPGAIRIVEDILLLPLTDDLTDFRINFPTKYYSPECSQYHIDTERIKFRSGYDVEFTDSLLRFGDVKLMAYHGYFDSIDVVLNHTKLSKFQLERYTEEAFVGCLNRLRVFGPYMHPDNLKVCTDQALRYGQQFDDQGYYVPLKVKLYIQAPDNLWEAQVLDNLRSEMAAVLRYPANPDFLSQVRAMSWGQDIIVSSHEDNVKWLLSQPDFDITEYSNYKLPMLATRNVLEAWERATGQTVNESHLDSLVSHSFNANEGDIEIINFAVQRGYDNWHQLADLAADHYSLTFFKYAVDRGGYLSNYSLLITKPKLREALGDTNYHSPEEFVIHGNFY